MALCAGLLGQGSAQAAPEGSPLDRPAAQVRQPERAVMLAVAKAGQRLVAVGERGLVLLSDDQGRRWRQVAVPVSVSLTAVNFPTDRQGYAVGHGGVVLATRDGGETWVKQTDGRELNRIVLASAHEHGDAVAQQAAERLVAEGADKPLLDVQFSDVEHGLVVGAYGLIFRTTDGGRHWQSLLGLVPNPKGLHLYAVRLRGEQMVLAGEQGLVLRSGDGGQSFQRLETGYRGSFFAMAWPEGGDLWLGGLRGNVLRSTDGGTSWSNLSAPLPASITAMASLPGGRVLLASQGGTAYLGSQGQLQSTRVLSPPIHAITPLTDGGLLTLTAGGIQVQPAAAWRQTIAGVAP
jgi:photosystem II stability/assembly factor-like uncharacterized protein